MTNCHQAPPAVAVLAKFPTAFAANSKTDIGQPYFWWIKAGEEVLSEPAVYFVREQDAWESAYLISVLGKTVDDIQVAAYHLWELEGRPEGEALANWLNAKGTLENETPPSA